MELYYLKRKKYVSNYYVYVGLLNYIHIDLYLT